MNVLRVKAIARGIVFAQTFLVATSVIVSLDIKMKEWDMFVLVNLYNILLGHLANIFKFCFQK